MNEPLTVTDAEKLHVAEGALAIAVKAFSDFDNTAQAWRRILDAESKCRHALAFLAAGRSVPPQLRGSSCFFGQAV